MQRFKSPVQAQNFLSAHAFIHGHFHPRRHLIPAAAYREIRSKAFRVWRRETRPVRCVIGAVFARAASMKPTEVRA
jgi:hypothetical protein